MPDQWIAPLIAGGLAIVAGVVGGMFARFNKRREIRDDRTPDAWQAAEHARTNMFLWQDAYYLVRGAFKGFARRMVDRHGELGELNEVERAALEAPTPDNPK